MEREMTEITICLLCFILFVFLAFKNIERNHKLTTKAREDQKTSLNTQIEQIIGRIAILDTYNYAKEDKDKEAKDKAEKTLSDLFEVNKKSIDELFVKTRELSDESLEALEAMHGSILKSIEGQADAVRTAAKNGQLAEENAKLREKQLEYRRFFSVMLETIREDTTFMKSSLFKRLGAVDEFQDINREIQAFQARLDGIEVALREYRMIETYEDE
jgi:hypothetical protein